MRVFVIILVAFLFVGLSSVRSQSFPDVWHSVAETNGNLRMSMLINPTKITKMQNGILKVWVKVLPLDTSLSQDDIDEGYAEDAEKNGFGDREYENFSHEMQMVEVDCLTMQYRFLASYIYDVKGNVIAEFKNNPFTTTFTDPIPNSSGDELVKTICAIMQ